jgi:hypothetical protein
MLEDCEVLIDLITVAAEPTLQQVTCQWHFDIATLNM